MLNLSQDLECESSLTLHSENRTYNFQEEFSASCAKIAEEKNT